LTREFERFGLEVDSRRLTLDPLHGLVARDVQVLGGPDHQSVLAQISEIALNVNYANLFAGEQALNAVDLQGAQITIPLDPRDPKSEHVTLQNLHARVYFYAGRIDIRQVTGDLYGIQLTTSGTLLTTSSAVVDQNLRRLASQADYTAVRRFAEKVLTEIRQTKFPREKPQLTFTFQVDLGNLSTFRLENGRFDAEFVERGAYGLQDLAAEFQFENDRAQVNRLQARDAGGELFATADWDFVSGKKAFQIRSTIDLASLLAGEPRCPWARDFTFAMPPQVEIAGTTTQAGHLQYFGRLAFDRFSYRKIPFQSLKAEFSRSGGSWMIREAEATHASGTLSGEAMRRPGSFRMRATSAVNPVALAPIFPATIQRALENWSFLTAPVIQVDLAGPDPTFERLTGEGRIFFGRTEFRQQAFDSGSASFNLKDGLVAARDVHVTRDERAGTGELRYSFPAGSVSLINLETTIDPAVLAQWLSPTLIPVVQGLSSSQPPLLRASGTAQLVSHGKNHLAIEARFAAPLSYRISGVEVHLDSADMHLELNPGNLEIKDLVGKAGAGTLSLRGGFRLPLNRESLRADFEMAGIEPRLALPLAGSLAQVRGAVSGRFRVRRRESALGLIQASGTLDWQQAHLEDFPLFASGQERFAHSGLTGAGTAAIRFRTEAASIRIEQFTFTRGAHQMELDGGLNLISGKLDLRGHIDGRTPVAVSGSLKSPAWTFGD
jgi:hypothetical protein